MPNSAPDLLLNYGPLALALAVFVGALGLPTPSTALLLAAGAFSRAGFISTHVVAVVAVSAATLGDAASYGLARTGLAPFLGRMRGNAAWRRAERAFERRGVLAILLSRFLLTPLALPTNLVAAGARYPFGRYLSASPVGEAVWVVFFGGLGYLSAEAGARSKV